MNEFRITGLDPTQFQAYFGQPDDRLARLGARRFVVDRTPGFPDRVELRDLQIGETAILLNYQHLDVDSPYRSSHAIFVREFATKPYDRVNQVPAVLERRLLSVRAFDAQGMMTDAEVLEGAILRSWILRAFCDPSVAFIDVHNAKRGCFAARVQRAK